MSAGEKRLSTGALRLHWYLSSAQRNKDRSEATLQELATHFGVTRRTLMRWIDELTTAGKLVGAYHSPSGSREHRNETWTWHVGPSEAECIAWFENDFVAGRS